MAKETKDLYAILRVNHDASARDIKKSFRRLSKELHPDVNDEPEAPERFKEVQEAYEILKDTESRKHYDALLEAEKNGGNAVHFREVFSTFFGQKRTTFRPINGEDIKVNILFDVPEVLNESEKSVRINRHRLCGDCEGKGYQIMSRKSCEVCEGKGHHFKDIATPFGKLKQAQKCEACKGTGYGDIKSCMTCERTGWIPDTKEFRFDLPKTAIDGETLTFEGEGEPGRDGGKPGHLIVTLRHKEYDVFKIEHKYDVARKVPISLQESLSGGKIPVSFPNNEEIEVEVPKGVQNGQRMSFPNCGLYMNNKEERGFFYVEFEVRIPSGLSDVQIRRILEQLEE